MKTNCWLILGAMLATSAIAQDNTNALPEIPPPATLPTAEPSPTPAPAVKATAAPAKPKKHVAPKKKISEPTVSLVPGPAEVTGKVNVRGQAGLKGEVIAHLFNGDTVNVLEQINLGKHAADEPAQWAKISYPTNANVWVNTKYIDADTKTVKPKKLNLRAGPGENFSVVGSIEHGTPVNEIETKGNWIKIQPPANTYAFLAAMYLKQEAPAPVAPTPMPTEVEPTPAFVPAAQTPTVPEPTIDANIPRVATHEGVVRHVASLITPTEYELYSSETDKNIDYLYSTTTNLDLGRYVGMRIIVTGEESLASRWTETPVLTVEKIIVLDTNAVPQRIYRSPRQQQERGRH